MATKHVESGVWKRGEEMTYFDHFKLNMKVAGKALLLFNFHVLHALIPTKYTDHKFYGLVLTKPEKEKPMGYYPFPYDPRKK